MRNGLPVPISYSLGITYSLYDLAERQLEVYHTNCDSYSEIIQRYLKPKKKSGEEKKKLHKDEKKEEEEKIAEY